MLTAYNGSAGSIVEERWIHADHGKVMTESQVWNWPAVQVPGQPALTRFVYRQRIPASAGALTIIQDTGASYVARPGTQASRVRFTQVCYPANPEQGGCGYNGVQTRTGTWSMGGARLPMGSDLAPGSGLNPATIADEIISGQWYVARRARLDGQPAIEIRPTLPRGQWRPVWRKIGPKRVKVEPLWMTEEPIWVNEHTHLPMLIGSTAMSDGIANWQEFIYLPATPANLALLRVQVPRGLPRSKACRCD
jgi:hypothetical protein